MKQKATICTICGTKSTSSIALPYSDGSKEKEYYIFKCCNYYRQKNFLTDKEIESLYSKDYEGFQYTGLNYYKRKLFLYLKVLRFEKYIKGKDVLEIGASTGDYLDMCRHFHPTSLSGVELSKHASSVAKKKYGFSFINKDIDTYKTNKKFDTIFMFHVIEHLKDPIKAINSYEKLLKKGGILIMETPNIDSWEYHFFSNKWIALKVPFHLYLFSSLAFKRSVQRTSFQSVNIFHEPVTITYPLQFYCFNKVLTQIFYIPLFAIYELIYYISALIHKSGAITVYMKKK